MGGAGARLLRRGRSAPGVPVTDRGIFLPGFEVWRGPDPGGWAPDGATDFGPERAKVATVRGRAYPRGTEEATGFRVGETIAWVFACPPGTDLRRGDHIVTPSDPARPAVGGRRLRVVRVLPTGSGRRLQCMCEEPE